MPLRVCECGRPALSGPEKSIQFEFRAAGYGGWRRRVCPGLGGDFGILGPGVTAPVRSVDTVIGAGSGRIGRQLQEPAARMR